MESVTSYHLIIIFSLIVIVSYFFNVYSKKSGVPSVLMLLGLGVLLNGVLTLFSVSRPELDFVLKVFGEVGLVLIVLEAALDLKLLKEKIGVIVISLLVSIVGLLGTSCLAGLFLSYFIDDLSFISSLLYTIPLSILSSAIILPSIGSLKQSKKEFMIYESTFSDIFGIISFYAVKDIVDAGSYGGVLPETFISVIILLVVSVVISYVLIYVFQNLKEHAKLFLLISVLLLLYSVGKTLHVGGELIIIFGFGIVLNNSRLFIIGGIKEFFLTEKVEEILEDFKLITIESAFIVRTFFFIIFGWSISLISLFDIQVLLFGIVLIFIIYLVRMLALFVFNRTFSIPTISPELFLAPRGLITILLFFSVPKDISSSFNFDGILLFIIITSCLIMTWSLIKEKKRMLIIEEEEFESISHQEDGLKEENNISQH